MQAHAYMEAWRRCQILWSQSSGACIGCVNCYRVPGPELLGHLSGARARASIPYYVCSRNPVSRPLLSSMIGSKSQVPLTIKRWEHQKAGSLVVIVQSVHCVKDTAKLKEKIPRDWDWRNSCQESPH